MNIVVTGGASGVGAALVARLASHAVWVLDRAEPAELADGHHFLATDLSDAASVDATIAALPERIDALANVAGIATAPDPVTVLAVNFLGLRQLSEAVMTRLPRGGRLLAVSSMAGADWKARLERLEPLLVTNGAAEGRRWCEANREALARDPYTFSKRLVTAWTMRTAQRGLRDGFTINVLSPGPIETPLSAQFDALMGKAQSDWTTAQTGRAAQPDEIAAVAQLLLTGDCGWLNGVDVPVDGGYRAGLESGWIDFSQSPVMAARAG